MSDASSSQAQDSQNRIPASHSMSNDHSKTQGRKRRKVTNASEIFARPNVEEQLKLGKKYRTLQDAADDMKANLANATAKELAEALSEQSELFANVKDTGIGTLDANLIRTNTENAIGLAKRFKIDGAAFDIDEYLLKIKSLLCLDRVEIAEQDVSSDDEGIQPLGRSSVLGDWEKIGWMAARYYRRVTGVEFMYGPLTAEYKQRKAPQRRVNTEAAPEIQPTEVITEKSNKKAKDEFMDNIKIVLKTLHKLDPNGEGVNLFRLILNPHDFGQTVENCFFLSFLINQGSAGIYVKPDGEVMAMATTQHDAQLDGDPIKNQAVLELDVETWKMAKETFNIQEPSIPHRQYEETQLQRQSWY
ncbi:uncharacterized protein L203_102198 [Cryptococcus depauperatus CBS 7841]|uniref:Non-structural maintenance of chromosomes element 4 n=1 Tax=Cryptococcus depauperatus CBS 7841 TaxID=1295531 RepID=A0AAJ8JRA7_9TREE